MTLTNVPRARVTKDLITFPIRHDVKKKPQNVSHFTVGVLGAVVINVAVNRAIDYQMWSDDRIWVKL